MMGKSDRNPLFSVTLPALAGGLALVALVGGFGAWAASARIDGAVIAPGRIVVDRNRQAVQHLDGGMVAEVLVKEGDRIEAGALLVRLDPTLALSELAITESRLYELMARRGAAPPRRPWPSVWAWQARPPRSTAGARSTRPWGSPLCRVSSWARARATSTRQCSCTCTAWPA